MKILGALLVAFTLNASAQVRETPVATAPLGPAEGSRGRAMVASNGSDFFVVWPDDRGGTFGTRVTHEGEVLDKTGIHLSDSVFPVAVLWCGGTYTVIFYEGNSPTGTSVVRVDAGGKVIDGPRLAAATGYPRAAATNGSTIVIVADILTILDDHAHVIDQLPSPVPDGSNWSAASNGNTYELATWRYSEGRNWVVAVTLDGGGHVQHTLYSPDKHGQPKIVVTSGNYRIFCESVSTIPQIVTFDASIDPSPVTPFLATPNDYAVIGTGSNYLLALRAAVSTEVQVYRASGDQIDPAPAFATASKPRQATSPAFAVAGDAVLLGWVDYPLEIDTNGGANMHAVILDDTGRARTPAFDLTLSATAQHSPALATGGANDLVAWQESSGIYAARVTPDGVPLDGRGTLLSTTGSNPQVIFDGSKYVVSWAGGWVVNLRWVDPESGTAITTAVAVDTPAASSYFIGRDASGLVLFFTGAFGVKAQRIGIAGAIGPAVQLATATDSQGVSAAWNGSEWLVVWNDLTWHYPTVGLPFPTAKPSAIRLLESLTPVEVAPMGIADSSSSDVTPLATTNGDGFLVAWSASSGSYTRTVTATGTLGDSGLLAAESTKVRSSVWDGSHYAIAYRFANNYNLLLTHVGLNDQLMITRVSPDQHDVSLAATDGRPLRAAYSRTATEPQYGYVSRVFTRDLVYARRRIAPH